jgi:hypothetical protein
MVEIANGVRPFRRPPASGSLKFAVDLSQHWFA